MMVDSHIHLSHSLFDNEFPFLAMENGRYTIHRGTREQLIGELRSAGVKYCIDPAIDLESNRRALCLAKCFPDSVFPAVGIHPSRTYQYKIIDIDGNTAVKKLRWKQRHQIREWANQPNVIAIGETGLDYHLAKEEQHRFRQKMWFVYQIRLAHQKRLPLILHIRDADADTVRLLRRYRRYLHGGVCHCFRGSAQTAGAYINLGLKLGIGASLLQDMPQKSDLEEAVIQTPLEDILLETDGPYVKPQCPGTSGKQARKARNTSLVLPAVAERIAALKGISVEKVMDVTSANAINLFRLGGLH